MRLGRVYWKGEARLATEVGNELRLSTDDRFADLDAVFSAGGDSISGAYAACRAGEGVDEGDVRFLPPLARPPKIICVGLNYDDHASESGFEVPDFPTLFARFPSSLIGHGAPIVKPRQSDQLDFEGEMVAVIGTGGRHIAEADATRHVAAYSIFNDASLRDFQMRTPQWTAGKNFDGTGAFGPWLVTTDELPDGAAGLRIETRLNGEVVQRASTTNMVFGVARLVSLLSDVLTLAPGDVLVTGTPAGVGMGRTPPLWMRAGDRCEVEIEGIGLLSNPVVAEA